MMKFEKIPFERETKNGVEVVKFTRKDVLAYIDNLIEWHRASKEDYALYYVDAYQSIRTSLFGELKPMPDIEQGE